MEESVNLIESLYEKTRDYGRTNFDLIKLKTVEKTTDVVASVVTRLVVMFFSFMFILTLSVAVSIWLGEWLQNYTYGFFLVAGFYGVIAFFLGVVFRKSIKSGLHNSFIKQMLS
ncbi:MAG TPA: phage holin family protein [Flavobacteriales bacterium]|nr:phage holin family protein [Flavobacteriales bacterium]